MPLNEPAAVGAKVIVRLSEPPAAMVTGSVTPATLNAAFPVLICETVALALPLLLITRICVLPAPTATLPNEIADALACKVAEGAAVAVPLSETCCGLDAALSVKVTAPVRVPVAVGAKTTEIVQLAFTARLAPQLFDWAKSPEAAMPLMASAAVPLLVKVTACAGLVVVIAWLPNVRLAGDKLTTGATPVPLSPTDSVGLVAVL